LAEAGAGVCLTDIDEAGVTAAAAELVAAGLRASARLLDVTDDKQV
jgi:hypothetical protein